MASINKVILIGNLGRDPELRYMASGSAVCTLKIATSRNWKSKETGERVEETEWHTVVLFERQAEVANEYLKKGRPVYIEGRLKTRKWQDKDGNDRYTTEIVGEAMQFLGGREGGGGGDEGYGGGYGEPSAPAARPARPAPAPRSAPPAAAPAARPAPAPKAPTSFDDMDDDIPF